MKKCRADGGGIGDDKERNEEEREKREEKKAGGAVGRAHGGHVSTTKGMHMSSKYGTASVNAKPMARKHGGKVDGEKMESRPDKRARGGGVADKSPYTTAGKVSEPSFVHSGGTMGGTKGAGKDRD